MSRFSRALLLPFFHRFSLTVSNNALRIAPWFVLLSSELNFRAPSKPVPKIEALDLPCTFSLGYGDLLIGDQRTQDSQVIDPA